jgi:dihydrofolate synthase/folylpolyglutamate synthase
MNSPRLAATLARLDVLVDWERRDRRGMRQGLDPVIDLLGRIGDPHRRFRAVHVTGTKGKGSTSALIAAGLARARIRTGSYTSPHVDHVTERVRIDGTDIGDDVLADALERVLVARDAAIAARTPADEATWFDVLTSAAFLIFSEAGCEWAVVECGIGGRLDSTNVVRGEVCVITNVDLEHTRVLGPTRAHIAREKAGILKRGATLVTTLWPDPTRGSDDDPGTVVEAVACQLDVPILRPTHTASTLHERNADLARLVLDELGRRGVHRRRDLASGPDTLLGGEVARDRDRTPDARRAREGEPVVERGQPRGMEGSLVGRDLLDPRTTERARLPARLERFCLGSIPVILDGAHVASSVALVLEELSRDPGLSARPVVVLALGRDKDAPAILKTLRGRADRLVCTTAASGPLRATETLVGEASREGFVAETATDPSGALAKAARLAGEVPGGWVLVIGSFYLAGAVRPLLQADPTKDPRC